MYAFKDEIFNKVHAEHRYVGKAGDETLPVDSLWHIASGALGEGRPVTYLNTYSDPLRAWEFKAYHYNNDKVLYFNWCEYDLVVYVNPYNGEVLHVLDHKYEFFQMVKMFHWSFWLNTKYGQPIVGWTVVLFVVALLSGLVLWWPTGKRSKRRSFVIKRTRKWKVLNYDLHNVLGFYSIPFALVLSFTGMVWAFKWFMALVYLVFNLSSEPPVTEQASSVSYNKPFVESVYETVYQKSVSEHPDAYSIMIRAAEPSDSGVVNTFVKEKEAVYYKAHQETFDKYTGEKLTTRGFDDLNRGEKVLSMNYDIHVGAILGLPGKILVFVIALIAASMPVTGFIIWWNRRKKRKKITIDI
jgi:uncharacterized iron-regulated membrane protein